jgi:hypothetical protein
MSLASGRRDSGDSDERAFALIMDCVKEIIKGGPDFGILNEWGETAAEDAADRKFHDIVILIKRAEMKIRLAKKGH